MNIFCGVRSSQPWIILSVLSSRTFRKYAQGLRSPSTHFKRSIVNRGNSRNLKHNMAPALVDVDCNLLHSDMKTLQKVETTDPWHILEEDAVKSSNIVAMISPSSTIAESESGIELLKSNPPPLTIKTTVGVHPYHVNDESLVFSESGEKIALEEQKVRIKNLLLEDGKETTKDLCAAVGECGLDASEGFPPLEDQIPWFKMQIEIAEELGLPLFVHERLAFEEAMGLLANVDPTKTPVIIHCFTGTKTECISYIERGYSISVSGYILKASNDNCAEVVSCLEEGIIPLDKLMIETDAPYMGFDGCRQRYLEANEEYVASLNSKKRKRLLQSIYPNVPSSLPMVLSKVTECLQKQDATLTEEKLAEITTENAQNFFGLAK